MDELGEYTQEIIDSIRITLFEIQDKFPIDIDGCVKIPSASWAALFHAWHTVFDLLESTNRELSPVVKPPTPKFRFKEPE